MVNTPAYQIYQKYLPDVEDENRWLWEAVEGAYRAAEEWGLPADCREAVLLLPLWEEGKISEETIIKDVGRGVLTNLRRISERQSLGCPIKDILSKKTEDINYISLLRQYIRQIYLDYPHLEWILCLIGLYHILLEKTTSEPFVQYAERVFIPIVEMMGLWEIRNQWRERIQYIKAIQNDDTRQEYERIVQQVQSANWHTESEEQQLLQWIEGDTYPQTRVVDSEFYKKNRICLRKYRAFLEFHDKLFDHVSREKISPLPDLRVRPIRISSFCEKAFQGAPIEELLNQLRVELICEQEADCYRLMGIVHGIGRPLAPRFTQGFNDYIADAKENGFRALNTGIIFRVPRMQGETGTQSDIVIKVRIATHNMDLINRQGVIQALYKDQQHYLNDFNYSHTWWHPMEHERLLAKINRFSEGAYGSLREFIERNPLDTRSEYIYVFTPRGQIKIMKEGSTPLDLAYEIHSELGNHAASIQVNEESTDLGYLLKNGDIIKVIDDPNFAGPDLSWLTYATTSKARRHIRAKLFPKYEDSHPGKLAILNALERTLSTYFHQKKFPLGITSYHLESYLKRVARARGIDELEQFYNLIRPIGNLSPYHIVQGLISEELADSICDPYDQPLDIPSFRISLCQQCRPVPGEPIVGLLSTAGPITRMLVHQRDCSQLLKPEIKKMRVQLKWRQVAADSKQTKHLEIQLLAENHPAVLWNVLECIEECRVHQIHSFRVENDPDGTCEIDVKLSLPSFESSRELKKKLEGVQYVHQVWAVPISIYQVNPRATVALAKDGMINPYYERPVYLRDEFYDREEPIKDILSWLQAPLSDNRRILHGARRVGKTSLAYHIVKIVLRQGNDIAQAIYLDLSEPDVQGEKNLLNAILRRIYERLNKTILQIEEGEDIIRKFAEYIQSLHHELDQKPILVVLDEFDRVVNQRGVGSSDRLSDLFLTLFNRVAGIKWLIILSDTALYEPEITIPATLLQKSNYIAVNAFEWNYAQRLIIEPALSSGIHYQEKSDRNIRQVWQFYPLPDEMEEFNPIAWYIFRHAGGNPFYIKNICYYAWESCVHSNRHEITFDDVQKGITKLIRYGKPLFDHFLRVGNVRLGVLKCISDLSDKSQWVKISRLKAYYQKCFRENNSSFADVNIEEVIEILINQGYVEYRDDRSRKDVGLKVPLFGDFARTCMMDDLTIQIPAGIMKGG
jgi:(p)ppGpp synthase/HD superfamily hydrolase